MGVIVFQKDFVPHILECEYTSRNRIVGPLRSHKCRKIY